MCLMKYNFLSLQSWNLTCLVIIQLINYGIEGATDMETWVGRMEIKNRLPECMTKRLSPGKAVHWVLIKRGEEGGVHAVWWGKGVGSFKESGERDWTRTFTFNEQTASAPLQKKPTTDQMSCSLACKLDIKASKQTDWKERRKVRTKETGN